MCLCVFSCIYNKKLFISWIVWKITIVLGPRLIVWPVSPCFWHQDEGVVRGAEVGVAAQPLRITVHREEAAPGHIFLHLQSHNITI